MHEMNVPLATPKHPESKFMPRQFQAPLESGRNQNVPNEFVSGSRSQFRQGEAIRSSLSRTASTCLENAADDRRIEEQPDAGEGCRSEEGVGEQKIIAYSTGVWQ